MIPQYGTYFVPESVLNYPSMATKSEKAVLYWLARNHFRGDGIIVDAGIYLGGSTNALAHGVRDNPKSASFSGKVIQSYDIAVWTKGMARKLPDDSGPWEAFAGKNLRPGKSFEAALRGVLEPHADLVDLRIGDIIETAFAASPVEIAFYDCLKTNQRDIAVFKAFAPHYVPGHSIILQQDYFYVGGAYNKMRQEYFSEYFEFLGQFSTTAVFRYVRPIPDMLLQSDPVTALPLEDKLKLLRKAVSRASTRSSRMNTELSIGSLLLQEGERDLARENVMALERKFVNSKITNEKSRRNLQKILNNFKRRLDVA